MHCKVSPVAAMPRLWLRAAALLTAVSLICAGASPILASERSAAHIVKLNTAAYEHARELIIAGQVTADGKGAWRAHQPSAMAKTEFIRSHGFSEYAQWHLGVDEQHGEHAKARYKFPYGDFNNVHRCALLAVKSRAREYGHFEVEHAAVQLLELIRSKTTQLAPTHSFDVPHAVKNASINSGR
jgi:hypothetical protein